jgi:hypothetical protein
VGKFVTVVVISFLSGARMKTVVIVIIDSSSPAVSTAAVIAARRAMIIRKRMWRMKRGWSGWWMRRGKMRRG